MREEFDPLDPLGVIGRMQKTREFAKKVVEIVVAASEALDELLDIVTEIRDEVREIRKCIEEIIGGDINVSSREVGERSDERSRRKVRKSR